MLREEALPKLLRLLLLPPKELLRRELPKELERVEGADDWLGENERSELLPRGENVRLGAVLDPGLKEREVLPLPKVEEP